MSVHLRLNFSSLLEERELTQKDLSDMTGIRPAAISSLVRGYVERLTIDHLERIGNALEITDINELIYFEENKK